MDKVYLGDAWILRYEPTSKSQYKMFNTYTRVTTPINASMFQFLAAIEEQSPRKEIIEKFDITEENFKRISLSISKRWPDLLTEVVPKYRHPQISNDFSERVSFKSPVYSFPFSAEIHLTERCNLRCKHCLYSCDSNTKYNELSPTQWIDFFDRLQERRFCSATITGGEIFCYKGIDAILANLKNYKMHFDILTNALLINEKRAKYLHSENITLSISMDGSKPETHDYLRGNGAFKRLMKSMDLLTKEGVNKYLSVTIHAKNYDDLYGILKWANENDCLGVTFAFLVLSGRAEKNYDLQLKPEIYDYCITEIEKYKKEFPNLHVDIIDPGSGFAEEKIDTRDDSLVFCSGGNSHIAVSSDGNVYPCVYAFDMERFCAGNICDEDIVDIWKKQKFDIMRGSIRLRDLKTCSSCKMKEHCSLKNCRIRSLKYSGDLYGIPQCNPNRATIQSKRFGYVNE